MIKKSTHKKLRLVLHGQTIRDLRSLTPREFEQVIGGTGCTSPTTSNDVTVCTSPH